MAARKPKRMGAQTVEDEDYQLRYERVAGTGVAKGPAMVCLRLPPGPGKARRTSRTWEVTARVPDIEALAAELKVAGVERVPMESASGYWRIWLVVLEGAGLDVQLVNSSQARNLPGRPKTDKADAQWIARLTEMGLLRGSFVPPPEIRALRQSTRQLVRLSRDRTRYWQRPEKLLESALCKLTSVVPGLAGRASCLAMLEAMIAGERDPQVLAGYARGPVKNKHAALVTAFTGMQFGPEHVFSASSDLRMIKMLDAEITGLEQQVRGHLAAIPAAWGTDAGGVTGPGAGTGPDAAVLPAVDRLAEIPGVGPGDRRRADRGDRPGYVPVPDPARAGVLGRHGPGTEPVRASQGPREERPRQQLRPPLRRPGRQRRRPHGHRPRPAPPPHPQPPRRRMEESQRRRRPVDPDHRLAPAEGPRRPVHRPRPGPLREAHRHQPQGPQPQTPARSPRLRRHPHPPRGRLTR
jgi:hypothetical protein